MTRIWLSPGRLSARWLSVDKKGRPSRPPHRYALEDAVARFLVTRVLTIKTLIRVAFTAISLSSIGAAHSETKQYHHAAKNDHQNQWFSVN